MRPQSTQNREPGTLYSRYSEYETNDARSTAQLNEINDLNNISTAAVNQSIVVSKEEAIPRGRLPWYTVISSCG